MVGFDEAEEEYKSRLPERKMMLFKFLSLCEEYTAFCDEKKVRPGSAESTLCLSLCETIAALMWRSRLPAEFIVPLLTSHILKTIKALDEDEKGDKE